MDPDYPALYRTLLNGFLIVLAMIVMSCLISTMTVFMGGGRQGPDFYSLMVVQVVSIPVAAVLAVGSLLLTSSSDQDGSALGRVWQALPQWMVFGFLLLNSLVVAGEAAFLIVSNATEQVVTWTDHVPLISMLSCTLAFCIVFGSARLLAGKSTAMSGRW
jgi:hypothetical protein